jgi:hypothetical protein
MTRPSYTTTFPLTENPISESGNWTNTVNTIWTNPITTVGGAPGHTLGTGSSGTNDAVSMVTGVWTNDQEVSVTLFIPGAFVLAEVSLMLRMTMSGGNSIVAYEVDIINSGNAIQPVRWNGPQGNFTLLGGGFATGGVVDGDIIKANVTGPANNATINIFKNGVLLGTQVDTLGIASGNPGLVLDGETLTDVFTVKGYTARSLGPLGSVKRYASLDKPSISGLSIPSYIVVDNGDGTFTINQTISSMSEENSATLSNIGYF